MPGGQNVEQTRAWVNQSWGIFRSSYLPLSLLDISVIRHKSWDTKGDALQDQIRATQHQATTHHGAPAGHQDRRPIHGDNTTNGNSYGQMTNAEVYGAGGKTSSPTKVLTSSSLNRTLLNLNDLFGAIGRPRVASILILIMFAGPTVANLSDRMKSFLV